MRASCAEVGRDVGPLREAAVDAADPARAHEADPGQRARRRACRRPWSRRARRSPRRRRGRGGRPCARRPGLAEALELVSRRARRRPAVEHADRRRHGACGRGPPPPRRAPPPPPRPGGKPCATSVVSSATTGPPSWRACCTSAEIRSSSSRRHRPERATQRAAASSPSSIPPTRKPAASASPGAGRVDHLRRQRRELLDARGTAPRPRASRASRRPSPRARRRRRPSPTRARWRRRRPAPPRRGSHGSAPDRRRGSRSTRRGRRPPAPRAPAPALPRQRRFGDRLRQQRVAREVQPRAALEPHRLELVRAQLDRDPAVGRHRPLAVRRDERHHHAGRAGHDRPDELDSARSSSARASAPAASSACLATQRAPLAELGRPRRNVRRLAAGREPGLDRRVGAARERLASPHDHVEQRVAESADHEAPLQSWHGPRAAVGPPALVRDRRPARRLGRARRSAAPAPPEAPGPAGPRRLRGRALLPRDARARERAQPVAQLSLGDDAHLRVPVPNGHVFELFQRSATRSPKSARSAAKARSSACSTRSRCTSRARASTRPTTDAAPARSRPKDGDSSSEPAKPKEEKKKAAEA